MRKDVFLSNLIGRGSAFGPYHRHPSGALAARRGVPPRNVASGFVDSYVSPFEVSTTIRNLQICKPFHDDENGHGRLVFLFHVNGQRELQFGQKGETHLLDEPSLVVFFQPEGLTKRNIWEKGSVDCGISIALRPDTVPEYISQSAPLLPTWSNLMSDRKSFYWQKCRLPFTVGQVVNQALEVDIHERLADQYIHVKSLELMLLAMDCLLREEWKRSEGEERVLDQVLMSIESRLKEHLTLDLLAAESDISKTALEKILKAQSGLTFSKYVFERRMLRARSLLDADRMPLKQVAYEVGYKHTANFCIAFKRRFGITPSESKVSQ